MVLKANLHIRIRGCFCLLLVLPVVLMAQKIKSYDYDKATQKWRIETNALNLKSAAGTKMDVSMNASSNSFFIELMGTGVGTSTVDVDNEVVFLLDNDSVVKAKSLFVQSIDYGQTIPAYHHEYSLSYEALQKLSRHNLKSLRKFSAGGYDDIAIDKKNEAKMKELSLFFIEELKKRQLLSTTTVLIPPGFPGGKEVLVNFLNRNFKGNAATSENVAEKKATVQFIVKADGAIDDIKFVESSGTSLDNEVLRILKRMPNWKPALKNNIATDFTVKQEIGFYIAGAGLKMRLSD